MKITILQGAFLPVPPKLGGAVEKMWFALGKDFARRGHEVVHVSRKFPNMPAEEWIEGVLHKRVSGYATPSSGVYLKWLDLLYTLRARSVVPIDSDVVVTNTFWAPILLPSQLIKRSLVDVARMPKGQMWLYKHASRLRANSSPVAEAIKSEISTDKHRFITMIPNPLPFKGIPNIDLEIKKPVLLYTGRVHPEKGLELLIKAFIQFNSDWSLKIVGPWDIKAGGGGLEYLESLKRLAGDRNIYFTGPIYDIDILNTLYQEASIFVYPSIAEHGETFGLAPLEAMAWGCVPIVSDLACFRDFINYDKNGVVFDHRSDNAIAQLRDKIEHLQNDTFYRTSLAHEALKVQQSHSISFISSRFLKEFEKMKDEINLEK